MQPATSASSVPSTARQLPARNTVLTLVASSLPHGPRVGKRECFQAAAAALGGGRTYFRRARRASRAAMRVGTVAPIGNPDPAIRQLLPFISSSRLTAPLSDRLCDAALVAFALWTVCCHAVVAAGRGLVALLVLYAVVLIAGLAARLRWRPRSVQARPRDAAAPGDSPAPVPRIVRVAASGRRRDCRAALRRATRRAPVLVERGRSCSGWPPSPSASGGDADRASRAQPLVGDAALAPGRGRASC